MPEDRADRKGLESLIRQGDVDTVLTVFADGMGRLMGKRVVGQIKEWLDGGTPAPEILRPLKTFTTGETPAPGEVG